MNRLKELINILNEANHAYYNLNKPMMKDIEYDELYDELVILENETGIVYPDSPTQNVGHTVVSQLKKVQHPKPLLSLDKTKSIDELKQFIGNQECVLMLKDDGLTTRLDYNKGGLVLGATRGNGSIGELITHNTKVIKNIPSRINDDKLSIVGESIITFDDFKVINSKLPEEDKYASERNLAAGSVRQLDSRVCAERNVKFLAFGVLDSNIDFKRKRDQLHYLGLLGFETTPYTIVNKDNVETAIEKLKSIASEHGIPIDGLVCTYDDLVYGESLGMTSKFPRHSLAFKFADTEYETEFLGIEANTTRTGMISLTGLFKPVDVDGVTVSRASLHNVDIFESLQLGVGDTITVRRANMVIPQIMDNLTRSNTIELPMECPVCKSKAEIKLLETARFLYCTNDDCQAKNIKKIVHFVSRDAMNIMGLSEATIEKFVDLGFVNSPVDLYSLHEHKNKIVKLDGFGLKSYNKLIDSIEKSKTVELANFIYAIGIKHVGKSTGKALAKQFDQNTLPKASLRELLKIDDIGDTVANSIVNWFADERNISLYNDLLNVGFEFKVPSVSKESNITGKVFVVTGSVLKFKNRKELQQVIETNGGKVAGSVSKATDFLLNNDTESSSSKSKKAKELGIPIINEQQFLELIK